MTVVAHEDVLVKSDAPASASVTAGDAAIDSSGIQRRFAPRRERPRYWELRSDIPRASYRLLAASSFVAIVLLWWFLSTRPSANPVFVPTPAAVWDAARAIFADENLWLDVKVSFVRVTAGFLLAAVIGVPVGLAMGSFKTIEGFLQPVTDFVRYVPVPALIPICMVVFGIDELSKVMLIWLGTFFQLVLMVADEARRVPYELLQVSFTLGARKRETLRLVIWRAAMPGVFDALRLCNGWAWTYLVVAELVAANEGLGYRVLKFSRFLQTPKIWVYLVILGLIGLGLDLLFRALNRRLFRWADTGKA